MFSDTSDSQESLSFERREHGFALVRIDETGKRSEINLSESNILLLPRIIQEAVHKILAVRAGQQAYDVSAVVAVPVLAVQLNTDVHKSEVRSDPAALTLEAHS